MEIGVQLHPDRGTDNVMEEAQLADERLLGFKPLNRPPSEYVREHFLWGFQQDRARVELRHHMGVVNLIWASDFPHQESDFPDSQETLDWNFKDVPADERYKMVAGNVINFFHFPTT